MPIGKLNIKYFNARSLRSKLCNLHDLLYSCNFHVLCITETWLDDSIPNGLLDPKGLFTIYRFDRPSENLGGGVCVLINRQLKSYLIDIDYSAFFNAEIVACNICFKDFKRSLICCYCPPSLSSDRFNAFINCLHSVCCSVSSCTVIGDFNLPDINWEYGFFSL